MIKVQDSDSQVAVKEDGFATMTQGERLNYLLEERGPWNLTKIVNLCEIGPKTFNSVKFEAEKVISPNS